MTLPWRMRGACITPQNRGGVRENMFMLYQIMNIVWRNSEELPCRRNLPCFQSVSSRFLKWIAKASLPARAERARKRRKPWAASSATCLRFSSPRTRSLRSSISRRTRDSPRRAPSSLLRVASHDSRSPSGSRNEKPPRGGTSCGAASFPLRAQRAGGAGFEP